MMRKLLFVIIGTIITIAAICLIDWRSLGTTLAIPIQPEASDNTDTESDVSQELIVDTIMYADGHVFGYSGDVTMWGGWYFDTVPVGNNLMLRCDSVGPSILRLSLVTRSITVNIGSPNACDEIKRFLNPIKGFRRFNKEYEICIDSVMDEKYGEMKCEGYITFESDYADSCTENAGKINRFISTLAGISSNIKVNVPPSTALYIGYNPTKHTTKRHPNTSDMHNLSNYIMARTVECWKQVDDLPYVGTMETTLSIRAHISNPGFATFSMYTYDCEGSGHGMYTETFHSLDLENGKRLDNKDIFKPHSLEKIKLLLFDIMAKDKHYKDWHQDVETAEDVRQLIEVWQSPNSLLNGTEFEEAEKEAEFTLPEGALTNTGVVFSFQPYEIDCWAAGAYHFIIPYDTLTPYLTPKAKKLIQSRN